ncbi:hypothetical protein EUX98_g6094 [Antrodiella citrinella]|uniref:Uncharacterized protein n=1 Tax=Antrodiella citrinella TaxID=2447956 RepID=A0A4S4MQ80_9APHY|nr:hypothetical protein EUX98_g6094 [Antrodiella citrinella]
MSTIIAFGTAKAVISYRNSQSSLPNTLDWILGVVLSVGLYWLGLYEAVRPPVLHWFFHEDYARPILYATIDFVITTFLYFIMMLIGGTVLVVLFLPYLTYIVVTIVTTQRLVGKIFCALHATYVGFSFLAYGHFPFQVPVVFLLRITRLRRPISTLYTRFLDFYDRTIVAREPRGPGAFQSFVSGITLLLGAAAGSGLGVLACIAWLIYVLSPLFLPLEVAMRRKTEDVHQWG